MDVGLPDGQMGNSEVGHTNIGAGRIVYQELTRITKAIQDGVFFENEAFLHAVDQCKWFNSTLHIFGLMSDGGVHSHIDHICALLDLSLIHICPYGTRRPACPGDRRHIRGVHL